MRAALNVRFRSGDAPRILFIHRGRCFFQRWKRAHITAEYRDALALHSLEAFIGKCADVQPGKLSDCMLHETAVAWLRLQLLRSAPMRLARERQHQLRCPPPQRLLALSAGVLL